MKKNFPLRTVLAACALSCFAGVPADAQETAANPNAAATPSAAEKTSPSVLLLVRGASEAKLPKSAETTLASSVAAQLSAVGVPVRTPDFFAGEESADRTADDTLFSGLSPADAASLAGADYALILQISPTLEIQRAGTIYARQNVAYSLIAGTGDIVDAGRGAKIFSAPVFGDAQREMLALDATDEIAAALAEKIAEKKIVLSGDAATTVDAEIVCTLEAMAFPLLKKNADGSYSFAETRGNTTLPGVALKIGGVDVQLNADGSPTRVALPLNRPVLISASHRDILPVRRVVKIAKPGERVVIGVSLSDAARERWKRDSAEISAAVRNAENEGKLTNAAVELIRGKAKFWENSGVRFSNSVSREIKVEEKSALSEKID